MQQITPANKKNFTWIRDVQHLTVCMGNGTEILSPWGRDCGICLLGNSPEPMTPRLQQNRALHTPQQHSAACILGKLSLIHNSASRTSPAAQACMHRRGGMEDRSGKMQRSAAGRFTLACARALGSRRAVQNLWCVVRTVSIGIWQLLLLARRLLHDATASLGTAPVLRKVTASLGPH
jgi:hypothetical protein